MKKKDVQIGKSYIVKVSGKLVAVALVQANPMGGWDAINIKTGRGVRIKTAGRLRRPVDPQ